MAVIDGRAPSRGRNKFAAEVLRFVKGGATALGEFYVTAWETFRCMFQRPVQWREFIHQAWFICRISIAPSILMAIPFCAMIIFEINLILDQIGGIDLSGSGAGVGVIREMGPMTTVLVVAGAGATAICADLGSRKIREELDAIEVLGIDPIARLVVPRVAAAAVVAVFLNGVVTAVGITGGYVVSVYVQGATPGQFVNSLSLLTGLGDFVVGEIKAGVFGLLAGLVGCHLGMRAKGGSKGVGEAVNQTVVVSFVLLFLTNSIITTISLQA
ncbi:MlaE family ABC transporter permease [Nocardia kruczakiae]|uniref:MlaE family ABC transporter permease n=1 Tax=Nocardia kruczakiae TaxID=261477 RepID=UPI0007A385B4|nr:ABC transporter permease [Nocardia kruczakiae]